MLRDARVTLGIAVRRRGSAKGRRQYMWALEGK
jgi:hypothetical protein